MALQVPSSSTGAVSARPGCLAAATTLTGVIVIQKRKMMTIAPKALRGGDTSIPVRSGILPLAVTPVNFLST